MQRRKLYKIPVLIHGEPLIHVIPVHAHYQGVAVTMAHKILGLHRQPHWAGHEILVDQISVVER